MYNKAEDEPIVKLKNMQTTILEKLQKLSNLNTQYRNKQEKQFLGTFLHIMDRMSNQLAIARQQYQNIDKQIQKDEKFMQLSVKLAFFRNQCLALKQGLVKTQQKLDLQKKRQHLLINQKQIIQSKLFQKSKQLYKYKLKAKALSLSKFNKQYQFDSSNSYQLTKKNSQKVQISHKSPIKRNSISETKNTQTSQMIQKSFQKNQRSSFFKLTESQFRIKASKMSKQRKFAMNRTHFHNSNSSNINQLRKQKFLTQLLK